MTRFESSIFARLLTGGSRRDFALAIVLVGAVALAYIRVRHAGFIWDDESHLTRNPVIIGPLSLVDIWTTARAVYYPLVLTTFWVLHKFAGLNPLPYHVLNVCWHAASALLLWRVLRKLDVPAAWLGAAIWALHPVMVQSVAWVTEMKNTQSAFFYLLSISLFLSSQEKERGMRFYLLAIVSFVAAITSKPSTVMLPVVLALCLWWKGTNFRARHLLTLLPFIFISLAASAWTIWEQKFHAGASGPEWAQTPLQRLLISADAVWFYFLKLLWPHPLIFIYPRWQVDASRWLNYLPLVALLIAGAVLFLRRNRELRPAFFPFAYFVITLFPVLNFFDVYFFRFSFVSDHFQYLPSIGPLALIGAGVDYVISRVTAKIVTAALLLATFAVLTFHQTANYYDLFALYRATLAKNPRCWMAHYNLGLALKDRGELDEAIEQYQRAIETHPNYVEAHYNLGGALIQKGQAEEALVHFRRAIEIKSDDADSHNNYGSALQQLGRFREAEAEYRRAISLRPNYFDARINLGSLLLLRGESAEAITHLREAARLRPNDAAIHVALGDALMKSGRAEESAVEFRRALQMSGNDVGVLNSFAWLLATSADDAVRDGTKAVQLAERANEIKQGQDPLILHTLAAAYAEAGRFAQAIETARRGLALAEEQGNRVIANAIGDELPLYELGFPYRQKRRP